MRVTVIGRVVDTFDIDLPKGIKDHEIEEYVEWAVHDGYDGKYVGSNYELEEIKLG